ncbi:hypothetical protein [Thalassospira alkalitolerans]|uniref:hypothetical protein n=1 Tax=Thalassospira alkalitolerans TaxID=1293890 RepID=UPI003AA7C56C
MQSVGQFGEDVSNIIVAIEGIRYRGFIVNAAFRLFPMTLLALTGFPALACNLNSFDSVSPSAEINQTSPTDKTHFTWGSDVDPSRNSYNGTKAQHFIENLHNRNLSLHWPKAGLLIPFDNPLVSSKCIDTTDFGNEGAFVIDFDAPINTSNDGTKGAVAYVRVQQDASVAGPKISGTQIRATFTSDGESRSAITWLVAFFFPEDQVLQLDLYSGESGTSMAFRPESFGIGIEQVAGQLSEFGIENIQTTSIQELVKLNDLASQAFQGVENNNFIQATVQEQVSLNFSGVTEIPTGETSVLLFSPQGNLIAAKRLATWPLIDAN